MNLKDINIRRELQKHLIQVFPPSSLLINELKIAYGAARADIVVIDDTLHGYEIKSDADSLARLPNQVENYNRVFTRASIVCTERWQDKVMTTVPDWWGIIVAMPDSCANVNLIQAREPGINCNLDPYSLCQFLQKNELIQLIGEFGFPRQLKRRPMFVSWKYFSETLPVSTLLTIATDCLKARY